jgi:sensor c-di-GMP phosphodiesterase-like protein
MANPLWIVSVMSQLKSLGFMIGLDDFGKGYSSLSSLATLPIDLLKIDKAFVDELGQDMHKNSHSIVLTIIQLAKQLNKKVLAEGVENKEQVEWLTNNGCHLFQGYYFAKPMALDDFIKFYKNWK